MNKQEEKDPNESSHCTTKHAEEQCKKDTIQHINQVKEFMIVAAMDILERANSHDKTKLNHPELPIFTEYTPKLKNSTYGSEEYNTSLKSMGEALKHHYENNRHHPEHFEDGVNDMNLFDLAEMICDWMAAVKRHANGDINKSLEINQERFGIDAQLQKILINTVNYLKQKTTK